MELFNINNPYIKEIFHKVKKNIRLSVKEAIYLYENAPLSALAYMANNIKSSLYGSKVFYNKNFHVEPTNICVYQCSFCSFSTLAGWAKSEDEILKTVETKAKSGTTEIHITGGANPTYDLSFYTELIKKIRRRYPHLHIKAFTAIEIIYLSQQSSKSIKKVLLTLKQAGLDSMPGGGAEIFDKSVREVICPHKPSGDDWLFVHKTAHSAGITSNATMLYGHIESIEQRFEHLSKLRQLQDKTNGFKAFIPLKFKNKNNKLSNVKESILLDDLKTFAISRLFLDNIPHIKAYWPMLGKNNAKLLLNFGVDDIDGTIQNTTKIYNTAGSKEVAPDIPEKELITLIECTGFIPVERNSLYETI